MGRIAKISKLFLCTNLIFGTMVIFSVANAMKSKVFSFDENTGLAQNENWVPKKISGTKDSLSYEEYTYRGSPKITIQCASALISKTEKMQVLSCLEKDFIGSNKLNRVYILVKVEPSVITCEGINVAKATGEFSGLLVIRDGILWIETAGNGNKFGTLVELPPKGTRLLTSPFFVRTVGCGLFKKINWCKRI